MKIVLLGPSGQLGTDIRSQSAKAPAAWQLVCIDRQMVDLSNLENASKSLGDVDFDILINCSSYHKTDEVEKNAGLAFTLNAHLVRRLAEICAEKRARFVHISTDYVFGGQSKREPLTEDDGKAPINVYGASKSMGEDLALMTGADVVILRVASLFGVAGASGKGGNFVETIIRSGRDKGLLKVVNDQVMSPTSTADVANALWRMLAAEVGSGVWHVVNSGQATWYEFATRIIERAGVQASVVPVSSSEFKTVAVRPPYSVLDNAKLGSAVGPMRNWTEALDDYLVAKGHRNIK